jgi:dynein heavy chain 2
MPPFMIDPNSPVTEKVMQLHFILGNRMGCLILSPPSCGKTTLWKILKDSLVACGQHVIVHALNPKALKRDALLGLLNSNTREWKDGVLTKLARDAASQPMSTRTWIVCDGDIDPSGLKI